jgi:hypothetical protein
MDDPVLNTLFALIGWMLNLLRPALWAYVPVFVLDCLGMAGYLTDDLNIQIQEVNETGAQALFQWYYLVSSPPCQGQAASANNEAQRTYSRQMVGSGQYAFATVPGHVMDALPHLYCTLHIVAHQGEVMASYAIDAGTSLYATVVELHNSSNGFLSPYAVFCFVVIILALVLLWILVQRLPNHWHVKADSWVTSVGDPFCG